MPLVFNRTLTTVLILFGSILVANAQSGVTQQSTINPGSGWTFIQDNSALFCAGNISACTIGPGLISPTVAGSVWVLEVQTPCGGSNCSSGTGRTITSVCTGSGCSGTNGGWTACPNCAAVNTNGGYSVDAWYTLSGAAGTNQNIHFTLSGNSGNFISVNFIEVLPPPGTTASFDASGHATPTNCVTCTAVGGLNITGTDVIIQNPGGSSQQDWKSWSAPYITTANGSGIALNVAPGTSVAPTSTYSTAFGNSNPEFMAIAFKSTAGTFTANAPQYSMVNYTAPGTVKNGTLLSCNPNCTLPVPSTTVGNLLYLQVGVTGSQTVVSTVSCAGCSTWTVPTGANTCQIATTIQANTGPQGAALSCAYLLSAPSGVTSLSIHMSGNNGNVGVAYYEIASNVGGNFSLDVQGSHHEVTSTDFFPPGQALTLTGTDDCIIQASVVPGGSEGPNYYPQPYNQTSYNYFSFNEIASAFLADSASVIAVSGGTLPTPIWTDPQHFDILASGIAFTATGGSTRPNPPTGLSVIVQ